MSTDYTRWYNAGWNWAHGWTTASPDPGGVPDAWLDGFIDATAGRPNATAPAAA